MSEHKASTSKRCAICRERGDRETMSRYGSGKGEAHYSCILGSGGVAALDAVPLDELEAWPSYTLRDLVPSPEAYLREKIDARRLAERGPDLAAARSLVAQFEGTCDALARLGVVSPSAADPMATARKAVRAGLARLERRARPIAVGDEVLIASMNGGRGPTFLVSVARRWVTARGGHPGRYDIDTGRHERASATFLDPTDLARVRRMAGLPA